MTNPTTAQKIIADLQQKYNIPSDITSLSEIQKYIKEKELNKSEELDNIITGQSWLDGAMSIQKEGILDKLYDVFEIKISKKEMKRLTKKVPLGAIITFGVFNNILDEPATLRKEVSYLKEYYWDRGLTNPYAIATGINNKREKVTGGYVSRQAYRETGKEDIKYSQTSQYIDARPYGYAKSPLFAQKLIEVYNEIKSKIIVEAETI